MRVGVPDITPPTMKAKRRRHDPTFKARVALEALKGIQTIQQIAKEYEIHPAQVTDWKKRVQERLAHLFDRDAAGVVMGDFERERADLHAKIGQLTVEVDFLQKKSKQLGL